MLENQPLPDVPRLPVRSTLFKRGAVYYSHVRPPYWIRMMTGRESMRLSLQTRDESTARQRMEIVTDAYGVFFFVVCTAPCGFEDIGFDSVYAEFRHQLTSEMPFWGTIVGAA